MFTFVSATKKTTQLHKCFVTIQAEQITYGIRDIACARNAMAEAILATRGFLLQGSQLWRTLSLLQWACKRRTQTRWKKEAAALPPEEALSIACLFLCPCCIQFSFLFAWPILPAWACALFLGHNNNKRHNACLLFHTILLPYIPLP